MERDRCRYNASAELFTVIACLTGAGACTNATWTELTGEKPI